jgi:putative N6-adenine-specific DNA methylase
MNQDFKMVAKTLFGLEEILANELKQLGARETKIGVRNVSFVGDTGFLYKANLSLRTAIKILKPIKRFQVQNEDDLYYHIKKMNWSKYLNLDKTFAINATVSSPYFNHSKYIALKTKDAIADYFTAKLGRRPDVDIKNPDLRIDIHIYNNNCTVSLDSSGDSLHKRGYKVVSSEAPISEVLAAGIIMLAGWKGDSNFIDPMCGSGTILTEAAMIAANIPPQLQRESFAFEKWDDYDEELFKLIFNSSLKRIKDVSVKIMGYDRSPAALEMSRLNVENADLEDLITLEQKNFFKTEKPQGPTTVLFNPPYDERLSVDISDFYGKIGDTLKKGYAGSSAWFITGNTEALKHVGLRTSKRIKLYNGSLESRLVKYDLYDGTKKIHKEKAD